MTETFLRESTKFRVVPAPIQVPGTCSSCGSSNSDDRDYVDFGLTLDFYGVVYFCTFCITECANAIGFINPEQARGLEERLETAEKKISDFYTKNRALNDAIDLLRSSGLFDLVDGAASTPNEVSSSTVNEEPKPDNLGTNETNQHSNEQDLKQGPTSLSTNGNDELLSLGLSL